MTFKTKVKALTRAEARLQFKRVQCGVHGDGIKNVPNTDQRTGTVFLRIWMLKWTTLPGEPERNSLVLKCDVSATGKKAHLYRHTDKHRAKICGSEALRAGLERVSIKVPAAVMERHCWAAGWRSVERRNPHLLWSTFQHVLQEGRGKWSACVFILWQRWASQKPLWLFTGNWPG